MGKAQDEFNKFLEARSGRITALSEANLKAKAEADAAQANGYISADDTFNAELENIEAEGLKLQEAADAELKAELENKNKKSKKA